MPTVGREPLRAMRMALSKRCFGTFCKLDISINYINEL